MTETPPQSNKSTQTGLIGLYNAIKYKMSMQKEIDRYNQVNKRHEEIKRQLEAKINDLAEYNKLKIAEIESLSDTNKTLIINLIAKEEKPNFFKRLINRVFKFDGWVLYINKANEMRILKVKNFKTIYNLNDCESYGLKEKIGTFNNKPIFIVKYPYAMSLDIGENTLKYDSPTFYNYVNKVTVQHLTNWGSNLGLGDWIKKNFILIIIGIALILLFTTPQGKEFLAQIIPKSNVG